MDEDHWLAPYLHKYSAATKEGRIWIDPVQFAKDLHVTGSLSRSARRTLLSELWLLAVSLMPLPGAEDGDHQCIESDAEVEQGVDIASGI
jgi:hypothetical protein